MTLMARTVVPALAAVIVSAAAGLVSAPNASASMRLGNYEVASNRWNDNSWVWSITHSCGDPDCGTYLEDPAIAPHTDNLNVLAYPRPAKSQFFRNTAFYADGRYTLAVDVVDGVRCPGYDLPSHDVYSWDAVTLAGTIQSSYDAGCNGLPGGTDSYDFSLQRM